MDAVRVRNVGYKGEIPMAVKYGAFEMPETSVLEEDKATPTHGRFIVEPFVQGFGHTVGNAMRRMLLGSLEAPAIVSVFIEGVLHEYQPIEGVVEDMTNVILNFKGALLRRLPMDDMAASREMRAITSVVEVTQEMLDKGNGSYSVTVGEIVPDGYFEVVNPNHHLFTVTSPLRKEVVVKVAIGRGYVPSERHNLADKVASEIVVDSAFSPVRLVNYYVEDTRVGQDTDFDRLVLEVETDGRITPLEAVSFASQIGIKHFKVFDKVKTHTLTFDEGDEDGEGGANELMDKLALRIDEIELSVRSTNCLSGADIETIAELVTIPERRLLEFRNFGRKSLKEIHAKLQEMGLGLGMDLSRYGVTEENAREMMAQYLEAKGNGVKTDDADEPEIEVE